MQTIPTPDAVIRSGYLLIEVSNIDGDTFDDPPPMFACTPPTFTNTNNLMPCLIDVSALSNQQQDDLMQVVLRETMSDKPPVVCAWLASALPTEALARNIARFLGGPDAAGRKVLWRYYDPRVFALAMQVLSPAQAQALLGPIDDWRFPWCGRWWSVRGPGRPMTLLAGYEAAWPTKVQWASLVHSDLIAPVLEQLREPSSAEECLRYQKDIGRFLLESKQRLHLSDKHERVEYALQCMRYGDDFRYHPDLSAPMHQLACGNIDWAGFLTTLDETEWKVLRREFSWQLPRKEIVNGQL